MESWADVRLLARRVRARALETLDGTARPSAVLKAALAAADLEVGHFERPPGSGELGHYDRSAGTVQVARGLRPDTEASVLAHELGHHHLHVDQRLQIGAGRSAGNTAPQSRPDRYEGYSSREYKEVQADVFSAEFLCPTDVVRHALVGGGMTYAGFLEWSELPKEMVADQVARALLLPPLREGALPAPAWELDDEQRNAAEWRSGAVLVRGAGGTGKTTALVGRIAHLLRLEFAPASMLVLSSSHCAAEDVRARVARLDPRAGAEAWFGTFDDLAFEVVVKWHRRLGLPHDFRLLDHVGALEVLEEVLGKRGGKAQARGRPNSTAFRVFKDIQSRKRLSSAPRAGSCAGPGADDDEVHQAYDEALNRLRCLDLGGVASSAAHLLQTDTAVLADIAARFRHLLVDDVEEVDAAGLRMLDALAGAGLPPWATTSGSTSPYAYRGATADAARHLEDELAAASVTLSRGRRSHPEIQVVVDGLGRRPQPEGRATADAKGRVTVTRAATAWDEARAIRDVAEDWRRKGIPFGEQAVVSRSHLVLDVTASNLRALGLPVLHVGDLAERPEVRDLLALLSIDAAPELLGLLRVVRALNLDVSGPEATMLLAWARRRGWTTTTALLRAGELDGVSERAKSELARLGKQLQDLDVEASAARSLRTWLFERGSYLTPILADAHTPDNRTRLMAIHHLLRVCEEHDAAGGGGFGHLLGRVRRLRSLDQRTRHREMSNLLADVDAIRFCTMHASRGHAFRGLHVPAMAEGYVPAPWRGATGARAGGTDGTSARELHLGRERELLASTLSRAMDRLHLSWADRYVARKLGPSRFLADVPVVPRAPATSGGAAPARPRVAARSLDRVEVPEAALLTFLACPARYKLEVVDGLTPHMDAGGDPRRASQVRPGPLTKLNDAGPSRATQGPATLQSARGTGHSGAAGSGALAGDAGPRSVEPGRESLRLPIGGGVVAFRPDRVVDVGGIVRVRRPPSDTGRGLVPSSLTDALWERAAALHFPGRTVVVERAASPSAARRAPRQGADDAIARCEGAVEAIRAGDFEPTRDKTRLGCASCPWFLACGV